MEVIDKKSYSLFPVTRYILGVDSRAEFSEIPITFKTHIDSPIPIPDQEVFLSSAIKYNVYDLDEIPTTQNLLFDTPEDMIAKLEEWGFDFEDFKEKICFFPYNSDENAPVSNKLAKGWVKDISPNWTQWDALGIGKSFRARVGVVDLSSDNQYYGDVNVAPPTNNIYSVLSTNKITVPTPTINIFGLSNKPLKETKYIWIGSSLLKTNSTEPGAADVFSRYLTGTVPDVGAHRDGGASGSGVGNLTTGYFNGISHRTPYRGDQGFAIPILFKVDNPTISSVTGIKRVYGLIYFGYYEHSKEGTITNQKYFIKTNIYNNSTDGQSFYYKGSDASATNELSEKIDEFFENAEEWKDEDIDLPEADPYEQIQESENGGGDGTLDWTSDAIEPTPDSPVNIPGLLEPTSSGGLINLYRVDGVLQDDTAWLRYFRDFLFDDGLLSAMEKTNADIKSCIVSLKALPYNVECTQNAYKVILGKYDNSAWVSTVGAAVEAKKVTKQTQTLNLGSIEIKKFYGSYLDYSPHTKVQIFLPFIGVKELDTDEVMGKTLTLKYVCDNFTGLFTAHIYVDGQDLYNFNGSMAMELPISGIEYTNKLSGLLQTIGGAATTIGGVATAASGNPLGIAAAIGGIGAMAQGAAGYNQGSVYKTSNLGLDWGWLGCRQPHLIISSPRLAQPRHRNGITGKATCRTVKVSDVSGFNQFSDIHVDQVVCSDTERTLIKEALLKGVII